MFESTHRFTAEDAEGVVEVEVVADEDLRLGLDQLGFGKSFSQTQSIKAYRGMKSLFPRSSDINQSSPSLIFKLSRIELTVGGHDAAAARPGGHREGPVFDIVGAIHAHHVADPEADLESEIQGNQGCN